MIRCGVPARSIGIITFLPQPARAIEDETSRRLAGSAVVGGGGSSSTAPRAASRNGHSGGDGELEMHTADKFQGRDKEVILLSCVRSNEANNVGELLKDWRRVNVAMTRAKSKLVIVGSLGTLRNSGNETLRGLVGIVEKEGVGAEGAVRIGWRSHDFGYAAGFGSGSVYIGSCRSWCRHWVGCLSSSGQRSSLLLQQIVHGDADTTRRRDVLGEDDRERGQKSRYVHADACAQELHSAPTAAHHGRRQGSGSQTRSSMGRKVLFVLVVLVVMPMAASLHHCLGRLELPRLSQIRRIDNHNSSRTISRG